jgi:hypothetical protein
MTDSGPAAYSDITNSSEHPVLVGGQAVNLWAEILADEQQALKELAPFTSMDADIIGTHQSAEKIARETGWLVSVNPEPRNPIAAILSKTTAEGEFHVDVLRSVLGVSLHELAGSAFTVNLAQGKTARVPLPQVLLKAKIANLCQLNNTRGDGTPRNDLKQTAMLVHICEAYMRLLARRVCAGLLPERALINQLHDLHAVLRSDGAARVREKFGLDLKPALPLDIDCARLPKLRNFYGALRRAG